MVLTFWRRPASRVALLGLVAVLCCIGFMTVNVQTDWQFIIEYRGSRLLALVLTAVALGVSTILFQTITQSRLLTPSLMGFDVLYVLVNTLAMLAVGGSALAEWAPSLRFALQVMLMVALALLLFRLLFSGSVRSLHLMILLGMLAGMLFRELSELGARVLDPSEFGISTGVAQASFARVNTDLLGAAAAALAVGGLLLWRWWRCLDVLSLGRDIAINLGVAHGRVVQGVMAVTAILVSVATVLVGPTLFFGLLIANLAYWFTGSQRHCWTLPASVLAGIICLVGGQLLLEHLLSSTLPLALVIEVAGGLLFIVLLMRGARQ
ncbi:ferric siderophore ABC transporter permease BauC [Pseudomonas saudimassiliensis]|uniref:Ferric siderophore ABC transporter permease BauC n=1 Tax=Pseudomonas saudimassiliensis TaxID=1461581 RepID=A0A078MFY0_9PSED|nr:iron chelate uptake ABC transporter family permease subunit [Pseudomonas saudimassiliensis]CEA03606.1 ferric siderophore ABC transporter permease BauC [Pseudomonas saudimassiliensis]CEF26247.1 ferric siderophore ABC transporter permease BauC [Pseudomonas saudimassiliensis]